MTPLLEGALWNAAAATILSLAALAAGRFARRPALAHALWLIVLVKLVTPPLYALPLLPAPAPEAEPAVVLPEPEWAPLPVPVEDVQWIEPAGAPAPALPEKEAALSWGDVALLGWIGGAALLLAVAAARALRFGREVRRARPAPPDLARECGKLADRLGVRTRIDLRVVRGRISPLAWVGPGGARVLLPEELLGTLDAAERKAVLVHELAHVARRDHLVRLFELLVVCLWWWLPVAWWARRGIRGAEERCCDAWVAWAIPDGSGSYAAALIKTLDFLAGARAAVPAPASGMGVAGRMERRFRMIIDGRTTRRRLSAPARLALVVFALAVLPGTVGVATAQEAQRAPAPPPKPAGDEYEQRLDRLEKLTETLVEELKALRADRAKDSGTWVRLGAGKLHQGPRPAAGLHEDALRFSGEKGTAYTWLASDGRMYLIRAPVGEVASVDPETRKPLWVLSLGAPIYPQGEITGVGGGLVVFTGKGAGGKRYVVDAEEGMILQVSGRKADAGTPEGLREELSTLREKLRQGEDEFATKLASIEQQIARLNAQRDEVRTAREAFAARQRKAIDALERALEKASGAK